MLKFEDCSLDFFYNLIIIKKARRASGSLIRLATCPQFSRDKVLNQTPLGKDNVVKIFPVGKVIFLF